jgi:phosphate transport system permease protein
MTTEAPTPAQMYATVAPAEPLISLESGPRGGVSADFILRFVTRLSAFSIILMLAALLVVLTVAAMPSIRAFGARFLVGTDWRANVVERPLRGPDGRLVRDADGEIVMQALPESFGALNVIYGTAVSSAIALVFAVPVSLGAAIFLVRVASARFVAPVSFLIEFLAAIPSIAYGIWGLFVLAPFLRDHVEPFLQHWLKDVPGLSWMFWDAAQVGGKTVYRLYPLAGRDMLCGGTILAVMIVPIITAISRDVLRAVPRAQVEGTAALGATWWQSSREMLKFSRSGLFGAIMLGLARAAGETMAIAMVIGNNNQIKFSPLAPAQTMSSLLANEFAEANGELHPAALTEVALVLLVMSLSFNMLARWLVVGKGSRTAAAH